jgi:hypothetical protein
MIPLRVRALDQKRVRISGLHPFLANCLVELPHILEQRDAPAAHARLFPDPTRDDANANREWQQIVAPELRHLFESAGETVARDLTTLQPEVRHQEYLQITFPAEHVNAWMNALNQARLILGELYAVDERDFELLNLGQPTAKTIAVLKIQLLGDLLYLFVRRENARARLHRTRPADS